MTKKDHIKIAKVLKEFNNLLGHNADYDHAVKQITEDIADMLQEDNPRFNRETFINYINKS